MGIFVCLDVSKGLTQEEWLPVYQETLRLAECFRLSEIRNIVIRGIETECQVPCVEREFYYGWGETETGWQADSELDSRSSCETFFMNRDLFMNTKPDVNAADPMYLRICSDLNIKADPSLSARCRGVWEGKTSGEMIHLYLIAVGCLVADRLKDKAFIYGDITGSDFSCAVVLANLYLKKEISLPDQCVKERLSARIRKMNLSRKDELRAFMYLYKGTVNENLGSFIRNAFTAAECEAFWRERFNENGITTNDFDRVLHDYLVMGFEFEKVPGYVNFIRWDGQPEYRYFIRECLDLETEPENRPAVPGHQMQSAAPASAAYRLNEFLKKEKRSRWIGQCMDAFTFMEILCKTIGPDCDVPGIVEEWLNEKNESETMKSECGKHREESEKQCDIMYTSDLQDFRKGQSVKPSILGKAVKKTAEWIEMSESTACTELLQKTPSELCRWLAEQNRSVLLTQSEWEKIYDDIFLDRESFRRYYPMVRLRWFFPSERDLIIAMVVNDEFYGEMIRRCKQ